ncbi:MAG: fatty acid desaturase [Erythrobacter sp.]|nr:fatty acid desaturase [Erythrobacter sp.]
MTSQSQSNPALDPKQLMRDLSAFRDPSVGRSIWELAITAVLFVAVVAAMLFGVQAGYFITLALLPLAGLLLLRLFIIQHDCGHAAFFPSKRGNDWVGRALGVLTFTPYDCWQLSHARHHARTGNLDKRGFGDVDTLTVKEYREGTRLQRFGYRLYRHPLVLFGFGPAYLFFLRHRLPVGLMREGSLYWISAMGTNAVLAAVLAGLGFTFGWGVTALVVVPTVLIAGSTGVWLFYIQHQYEDAHWDWQDNWSFQEAALLGSSYLALPLPLRWFTGNIGIHHVHHLASTIPFYRLPEVLKAYPSLTEFNRYAARQTIRPLFLTLWDEDRRKLVSFREAKRIAV